LFGLLPKGRGVSWLQAARGASANPLAVRVAVARKSRRLTLARTRVAGKTWTRRSLAPGPGRGQCR
jgi:hypothetical protein